MTNVHEPVWRDGMVFTRQHLQRIDRANAFLGGIVVPVQGGMSDAPLSGTTHRLLGVADYRRWHMNDAQAGQTTRVLRDLCGTGHERQPWQGFPEPHFHDATLGDDIPGVMDAVAIEQINGPNGYRNGGDGVAGTTGDWQPYRPDPIRNYVYLEEPDMTPEERQELFRIGRRLDNFTANEVKRDEAERIRDRERFDAIMAEVAGEVDFLKRLLNGQLDQATRTQVKRRMDKIMNILKNDPDNTGVNNPDDGQMP